MTTGGTARQIRGSRSISALQSLRLSCREVVTRRVVITDAYEWRRRWRCE